MNTIPTLRSERLLLRPWRDSDRASFTALHADPQVTRHFPACLTWPQSEALAQRIREHFAREGFGLWCVELPGEAEFIGLVGLWRCAIDAPFAPALELAWRLAPRYWGQGYAREAAQLCIDFAFERLSEERLVAFTPSCNERSLALMQRLGMQTVVDGDFEHPALAPGHPLRRHQLFELSRLQWQAPLRAELGERLRGTVQAGSCRV